MVKQEHYQSAVTTFRGTNVQITTEGRPHLGAPLRSTDCKRNFIKAKVHEWRKATLALSKIATSQPHAAFTHGFSSKWSFLSRVVPDIAEELQPLEDSIQTSLLPAITGRLPLNDIERRLVALPVRLGGLGIANPAEQSTSQFTFSETITLPLTNAIMSGNATYSYDIFKDQLSAKSEVRSLKKCKLDESVTNVKETLPVELQRSMELAQEKGSSIWLTTLPIEEYGFSLHKSAFLDAIALRYNWPLSHIPTSCACGSKLSIDHALSCPKGGFPSIRHNEIRDLTANLPTEVCNNVCTEPELQPLTGEVLTGKTAMTEDGARLDIAANGLWGGRHERTFVDVRVFNPYAPSNSNQTLSSCYKSHEKSKKRAYEQRVREVEHAMFTPIVLSATGGMANEASHFYKRLASRLAEKWDEPYPTTMA